MVQNKQRIPGTDIDVPMLSSDAAGKLLENIFDACEVPQCSVPLDVLTTYSEYRREKFTVQKIVALVFLFFLLLLPLCFITPKLEITLSSADFIDYPVYEVRVNSWIVPIARVSASVDEKAVSVYESGSRVFSATPTENGTLTVRVTLANRQYAVISTDVTGIDVDAPKVKSTSYDSESGLFYIRLDEDGSGLDKDGIIAYALDGSVQEPVSVDLEKQIVVFTFPADQITIHIPDKKGNTLKMVLVPKS